ncbi:MAG: carotenoid oxygenase family protein [Spongiibacteraceae bacterium]|jgi:carotenoid cleavage dioxygenase|nr:carotenoid oxygenase family protein [Spongiibacteraceae bacterium]
MSRFPQTPDFTGALAPVRVEADSTALEVDGQIPAELNGKFVRVQPDPQFVPFIEDDIFFNGDGSVTALTFRNGQVDLRQRFVRTERFLAEREARRALFGRYRNRYTDDASVAGKDRTVANTTIIGYQGALLALKEDGLPYRLDRDTLETLGRFDFDGQLTSETFTAHPKYDPDTGHFCGFAFEARGDGSRDIVFVEFDTSGRKVTEIWVEAPFPGMIHDFCVTERFVVFPLIPLSVDVQRLRRGGAHFQWEPEQAMLFGVMRRDGDGKDLQWLAGPPGFQGHVVNGFDDRNRIYVDLPTADGNVFPFFPDRNGQTTPLETLRAPVTRWTFDMSGKEGRLSAEPLTAQNMEFGKFDERYAGRPYRYGFLLGQDWSKPYHADRVGPPHPFFFNTLVQIDVTTREQQSWWPGPTDSMQEPVFVPRSASSAEGNGWLLAIVNRMAENRSDIVVLDAMRVAEGPIATIRSPLRLRMGLHGNWVPAAR